jgi:hypothetical protein
MVPTDVINTVLSLYTTKCRPSELIQAENAFKLYLGSAQFEYWADIDCPEVFGVKERSYETNFEIYPRDGPMQLSV